MENVKQNELLDDTYGDEDHRSNSTGSNTSRRSPSPTFTNQSWVQDTRRGNSELGDFVRTADLLSTRRKYLDIIEDLTNKLNEEAQKSMPNRNLMKAMLILSIFVVLATIAVLTALLAPQLMPTALASITAGLSVLSTQGIMLATTAVGVIGIGAFAYSANQLRKSPTLFPAPTIQEEESIETFNHEDQGLVRAGDMSLS